MRATGWACAVVVGFGCGESHTAQPSGGGSGGQTAHTLTVHVAGNGSGQVSSSQLSLACKSECHASATGSATLVAAADAGSKFDGWQGACSGSGDCSVSLDADRDVTATFSKLPPGSVRVTVQLTGKGSGRVTSNPSGIDCPGTCSATVSQGSSMSLAAQPDGNSVFVGWGAGCSGSGGCSFTANGDLTVWVNFDVKPPPPPSTCAGISPPDALGMRQEGYAIEPYNFNCLPGLGDASGTLAFPRSYQDANAHGSNIGFVTSRGGYAANYSQSESLHPAQQPSGLVTWGDPGHLYPYGPGAMVSSWDSAGRTYGSTTFHADKLVGAADPTGGLLLAGEFDLTSSGYSPPDGKFIHAALMYSGGGAPPSVRWGPQPLAASGTVFGAGVDALGRSLVITGGQLAGSVTAQWFDRDGTALTGEFELLTGFVPGASTWFEATPLIGGGLAVWRMDFSSTTHAQALVMVASGKPSVTPAPAWLVARPDTRPQIARAGRAYAMLPFGANGVACSQRLEVVAPDGTSCGATDYPIAAGTCDTRDLTVAADGTVIQGLPLSMEAWNPLDSRHSCSWRYWPGAVK